MPKNFPKAPPPLLAATLAPLAWAWGCPDLFDSYSAGMILMQASRCSARCLSLQPLASLFDERGQGRACPLVSLPWPPPRPPPQACQSQAAAPQAPSAFCQPLLFPPPLPPAPQLAVPQLRPGVAQRNFNSELAAAEYDLNLWRR